MTDFKEEINQQLKKLNYGFTLSVDGEKEIDYIVNHMLKSILQNLNTFSILLFRSLKSD